MNASFDCNGRQTECIQADATERSLNSIGEFHSNLLRFQSELKTEGSSYKTHCFAFSILIFKKQKKKIDELKT